MELSGLGALEFPEVGALELSGLGALEFPEDWALELSAAELLEAEAVMTSPEVAAFPVTESLA